MDPVSIAASVIAILQAASSILSLCYEIQAGLKNTPRGLTQVIREIRDVRNITEVIQSTIDDRDKDTITDNQTIRIICDILQAPLTACLNELNWIEAKVKPSSLDNIAGSKRKAVLQALGWRLKDREVQESLESLDRCKSTLSLAISSQNM